MSREDLPSGIYCEDCIEGLVKMQKNSVDLVVTSPPYNVDLGNNKHRDVGYGSYEDNLNHSDYICFLLEVFERVWQVLRPGGRLCVNIGDGKNGRIPTHSDLTVGLMEDSEGAYIPITHIVWDKGSTSNRLAWGSWLSPSCPSFPRSFEHVLVFGKEFRKLQTRGETDLTRQEFVDWSYGLWKFPGETQVDHPAAFPRELPRRLIKMLSWTDARVLDPFAGSGTTLVEAKALCRDHIGFDIDPESCRLARKRLEMVTALDRSNDET